MKSNISEGLKIGRVELGKETEKSKRYYQLSDFSGDEKKFEKIFEDDELFKLITHVEYNYFGRTIINEAGLINDLNLFKTMKYDLELDIKNNMESYESENMRWAAYNRLKTINSIVYALESLKEEFYYKSIVEAIKSIQMD